MVYFEEFNKVSGSEAQKRAQLDFDDHQNEAAGRDTKPRRFLTGAQYDPQAIQKRREEQETALFIAQIQSVELARLCEETGKMLRETRQFLDEAREKLALVRADITAQEQDILSRTACLPDGTLVFQGEDGRAYTRGGKLCDDPNAQNIIWRSDHAKLTEIQLSDQRRELLEQTEAKVNAHDAELGGLEERYESTDDLTADELTDIQKRMQGIKDDLTGDLSRLENFAGPDDAPEKAPQANAITGTSPIVGLDNF